MQVVNKKNILASMLFFLFSICVYALPNFYDDEHPSLLAEKIAKA